MRSASDLDAIASAVGPGGHVFGLDLSGGMAKHARRLLTERQLLDRVSLVGGDAERLPFRSAMFDGIFMSFTLELFDTPVILEVLGECRRVLTGAGRIVAWWGCRRRVLAAA